MESFKTILAIEKQTGNSATGRQNSETKLSANSTGFLPSEIEFYRARVARIINKVLSLSILNKSNAEIQEMISVWSDALLGIVPESELDASLSKALRNHTTTFPVLAFVSRENYERFLG